MTGSGLYERYYEAIKKASELNKEILFNALEGTGVTRVDVEFDGGGVSGQIESVTAYKGDQQIDLSSPYQPDRLKVATHPTATPAPVERIRKLIRCIVSIRRPEHLATDTTSGVGLIRRPSRPTDLIRISAVHVLQSSLRGVSPWWFGGRRPRPLRRTILKSGAGKSLHDASRKRCKHRLRFI
jgi:hypothetical protein